MKKILVCLKVSEAFTFLLYCESVDNKIEKTSSKETEKLEKWLQKTEANLKSEFGVPDKVNFKTNGSREYVYLSKKLSISCERKFEINSKNIIIGFTSKNCF